MYKKHIIFRETYMQQEMVAKHTNLSSCEGWHTLHTHKNQPT